MKIKKIDNLNKKVIDDIVRIHMDTFEGFFLTFMGKGFLTQMYSCYCLYDNADIFVAEEYGEVEGFLAYSSNMSGLYKYMIKKKLIAFAWYSVGAFLRKPKVFMRLIRAFLKPAESERKEKYVELASIGVNQEIKSKGIGTSLINELKKDVNFEEFAYIKLETDAENNDNVNHFYRKNGFVLDHSYATPEGRKMNEYRYY